MPSLTELLSNARHGCYITRKRGITDAACRDLDIFWSGNRVVFGVRDTTTGELVAAQAHTADGRTEDIGPVREHIYLAHRIQPGVLSVVVCTDAWSAAMVTSAAQITAVSTMHLGITKAQLDLLRRCVTTHTHIIIATSRTRDGALAALHISRTLTGAGFMRVSIVSFGHKWADFGSLIVHKESRRTLIINHIKHSLPPKLYVQCMVKLGLLTEADLDITKSNSSSASADDPKAYWSNVVRRLSGQQVGQQERNPLLEAVERYLAEHMTEIEREARRLAARGA